MIISAPSGTGKSTVCRRLLKRDRSLRYSISCTTRPRRVGERQGRDYRFLDEAEFKRRIHKDEFLEWAVVHDHYYGTPRRYLDEHIARGRVVIMAIDVQGANAIGKKRPQTVTVFLVPPSWRSLEVRLSRRRQEPLESVHKRLASAPEEIRQAKHYDYLVVNDNLDKAVRQIESVIASERLRTSRQDLAALGFR